MQSLLWLVTPLCFDIPAATSTFLPFDFLSLFCSLKSPKYPDHALVLRSTERAAQRNLPAPLSVLSSGTNAANADAVSQPADWARDGRSM